MSAGFLCLLGMFSIACGGDSKDGQSGLCNSALDACADPGGPGAPCFNSDCKSGMCWSGQCK